MSQRLRDCATFFNQKIIGLIQVAPKLWHVEDTDKFAGYFLLRALAIQKSIENLPSRSAAKTKA